MEVVGVRYTGEQFEYIEFVVPWVKVVVQTVELD